jgi:dolichyl-phosphate-mannose-protein mannosyltransferase
MEVARHALRRLRQWQHLGLALLVLVTLGLHFSIINTPQDDMTDEIYYVNDARGIIGGEGEIRAEHPPLGQLLIAAGLALFGDTTFGWRIIPVVFGTLGIIIFYLVCGRLGLSRRASLIATFLLAFENLTFVQASIAMLDVFSVTFMLAAFWLYLRKSYALTGVAIALATLAKLTGGLALPVIALHWLITRRDRRLYFALCMVLAPVLFFTTMPFLDAIITGYPVDPVERTRQLLSVSASITFNGPPHPFASRPWEWVLTPDVMPYYWDPQYVAVVSFSIGALIIPTMLHMVWLARKRDQIGLFTLLWFAFTYLTWIPLSLLTDRMSYVFYFYPSVGAICLGLGWVLSWLIDVARTRLSVRRGRALIAICRSFLAFHATLLVLLTPLFGFWVPLSTALPPK